MFGVVHRGAFWKGEISDFVYDEEQDLYRFPEDSRFAFSKEYANVKLL